jgi:long-chain acyl-CoA synthetase
VVDWWRGPLMKWLGPIPAVRDEQHFGSRVVRCFANRPRNLGAMLDDAVAFNPQGEALVCGHQRLSYTEMHDLVARIAGSLAGRGVKRGDRVAMLLPNAIPFVLIVFALSRIGAIFVPLSTRETTSALAHMLRDCGASVILFAEDLAHKVPDHTDVPELHLRIGIATEESIGDWRALVGAHAADSAMIGEEETAAILYTSGTTGLPKGSMIAHIGLVHAAMIYEACMALGPRDRSVVAVPLYHVTGLTAAIVAMVRAAGTLILLSQFKSGDFIRLATAERMTHTVMVPSMYNLCLIAPEFRTADLSAWRIGGYGGAPMPDVTIERLARVLPNLALINAYGSTETTGPAVLMPPALGLTQRTAVGCATPVTDILVMDEDGREVASGNIGEVWLRSPSVVSGYWGNEAATKEAFVASYWRSGDLGFLDADGMLTLRDRKNDVINRGGYKIYSVEVENILMAHPAIVEAAIVARPCEILGERVHAFVVASTGVTSADLTAHCAARLADYKVPESYSILANPLPRNANGKILKRELRQSADLTRLA